MKRVLFGFLTTGFGLWLVGCTPEPDFSNVPHLIEGSAAISKYTLADRLGNRQDSLVVSVNFQDGDGDLGLAPWPSAFPEDTIQIKTGYNYQVRTFRRVKGQFQDVSSSFGVTNSGNFPRLRKDGKVGPIEGTLDRAIMIPHLAVSPSDTLKFMIRIRDRALNVSNEIETPTVVLRTP